MDPLKLEAYRHIFSLEYRSEDVASSTGKFIQVLYPHLLELTEADPAKGLELSAALLQVVAKEPMSHEHLCECFPDYCELVGVDFQGF